MCTWTPLETYMKLHGHSIAETAKLLNLSTDEFIDKMSGRAEFRISEIKILCDAFHLTEREIDKIFFGKKG